MKIVDENKLIVMLVTLFLALIFIVGSAVYIIKNIITNKNSNTTTKDGKVIEKFIESDLPDLSSINSDDNPVLYDFVNGSVGYHMNFKLNGIEDIESIGPFYAILYKDDESNIYVSEYNYGENMERPPIGSKPTRYKLDKGQRKNIEDFLSKVSKERIFNEKYKNKDEINVTLAIISMYSDLSENSVYNSCDSNTRWCGINLSNLIPVKYEKNSTKISNNYKSPMYITVHDSGYGYPSDWLKKDNYKDIMYNAGYNMDDEFWTRHNIDEKKFYTRKNDNGETETLTVTLDQINRFYINIDGNPCYFNEENLNNYLSMEGWQ